MEFIETDMKYLSQHRIRIDVLYWDMTDSRHSVRSRDSIANLERMYYKIIRWVVNVWGIKNCQWEIYPDENSALDWENLNKYLTNTRFKASNKPGLICLFEDLKINNPPKFPISIIKQQQSDKEPLIQLADFFAGISRFSKDYGNEYFKWLRNKESQKELTLFKEKPEENGLNKRRKAKFGILEKLDNLCKKISYR